MSTSFSKKLLFFLSSFLICQLFPHGGKDLPFLTGYLYLRGMQHPRCFTLGFVLEKAQVDERALLLCQRAQHTFQAQQVGYGFFAALLRDIELPAAVFVAHRRKRQCGHRGAHCVRHLFRRYIEAFGQL